MAKARNYTDEYRKFHSSRKQKQDRAKRNKVRRHALKNGRVKKGDNFDMHHPNGINGKVVKMHKSKNRGKKEKSRLKGSKRKKR